MPLSEGGRTPNQIQLQGWKGIDQSEGLKRNITDKLFEARNCWPTVEAILKRRPGTQVITMGATYDANYNETVTIIGQDTGTVTDMFSFIDPVLNRTFVRIHNTASFPERSFTSTLEFLSQVTNNVPPLTKAWAWKGMQIATLESVSPRPKFTDVNNPWPTSNPPFNLFQLQTNPTLGQDGWVNLTAFGSSMTVPNNQHAFFMVWENRLYVFPGPGSSSPFYWLNSPSALLGSGTVQDVTSAGSSTGATAPSGVVANDFTIWGYNRAGAFRANMPFGNPYCWGTAAQQLRPTSVAVYRGQFALAGLQAPFENSIIFCQSDPQFQAPLLPDAMVVAGEYRVGPEFRGDRIVHVISYPLFGGAPVVQQPLLILKRQSCWLATGAPTTDPSTASVLGATFSPQLIHPTAGCVSPRTVAKTPFGVIWASDDNVWLWNGGPEPVAIGKAIAPFLRKANRNSSTEWHAVYTPLDVNELAAGGIYRLAITLNEWQNEPTTTPGNATVIMPSNCTMQFWLDLRKGLPLTRSLLTPNPDINWWGPMELPTSCMHFIPDTAAEGRIQSLSAHWNYAYSDSLNAPMTATTGGVSNSAPVLKTRFVQMDATAASINPSTGVATNINLLGYDDHIVVMQAGNSGSAGAVATNTPATHMRLITHEFDFGDPAIRDIVTGLEFIINIDGSVFGTGYPLDCRWVGDGGGTVITPVLTILPFGFQLGTGGSNLGTGNTVRQFQALAMKSSTGRNNPTSTRFVAKTAQFFIDPPFHIDADGVQPGTEADAPDLEIQGINVNIEPIRRRPA